MRVSEPRVFPLGDAAITVRIGEERSSALLQQIHSLARILRDRMHDRVFDVVPSYLSITIFYDPARKKFAEMRAEILTALAELSIGDVPAIVPTEHIIRVRYNGPDLEDVATRTGLTRNEVIEIHTSRAYTVDLLGFVPGFAYLSSLDARLEVPRREQPRPRVPAGSVAIAGLQTGIYPLDTPGGWHILGSTTAQMFDATRQQPALLAAGDIVRFEPVV